MKLKNKLEVRSFNMKNQLLCVLCILVLPLTLISQESYIIHQSEDFDISGKGDNENWEKTEWLELTQRKVHDYLLFETRLKTLYSENGIYFLFECEDDKLTSTMNADFSDLWKEDVVEIFLLPDDQYPVYFEYEISPLNYELPILIYNNEGELLRWQPFHYESNRQTRHETYIIRESYGCDCEINGWIAEFFIPFKLIKPLNNVPPKKGDKWKANFYRIDYDYTGGTQWTWMPIKKSFHELDKFGTVIFN